MEESKCSAIPHANGRPRGRAESRGWTGRRRPRLYRNAGARSSLHRFKVDGSRSIGEGIVPVSACLGLGGVIRIPVLVGDRTPPVSVRIGDLTPRAG